MPRLRHRRRGRHGAGQAAALRRGRRRLRQAAPGAGRRPGAGGFGGHATGHYWKNLFAALVAAGHQVALLNPLRSRRFQEQDLPRTRTDVLDALGLARFGQQKRPPPTRLGAAATEELKELVRHRDRLKQDFDDRIRQLHRLVDLGFPEFTRYVRTLDSRLATRHPRRLSQRPGARRRRPAPRQRPP